MNIKRLLIRIKDYFTSPRIHIEDVTNSSINITINDDEKVKK
tara:strand:+ start:221272 stop:221397 length:126 start_codon:yes stop_codon:yes gene_type:complete